MRLKYRFWKALYSKIISSKDKGRSDPYIPDSAHPPKKLAYVPFFELYHSIKVYCAGMANYIPADEVTRFKNFIATCIRLLTKFLLNRTHPNSESITNDSEAYQLCYNPSWGNYINAFTPDIPIQPDALLNHIQLEELVLQIPWVLFLKYDAQHHVYYCDTRILCTIKPWPDFLNPGSYVTFKKNKSGRLTLNTILIPALNKTYSNQSSKKELYRAKRIVISGLLNYITQIDHFVYTHLNCSLSLSIHTRNELPTHHPLYALLLPHVFGSINTGMSLGVNLFDTGGAMEGILCFPNTELYKLIDSSSHYFNLEQFDPEENLVSYQDSKQQIPIGIQDIQTIYKIIQTYISDYIYCLYPTQANLQQDQKLLNWLAAFQHSEMISGRMGKLQINLDHISHAHLIKLISVLVFTVSVRHHLVGVGFVPYAVHSKWVTPVIYKNNLEQNIAFDRYQQIINSLATASIKAHSLVQDYSNLISKQAFNRPKLVKIMKKFQNSLLQMEQKIYDDQIQHNIPMYLRIIPSNINASTAT